MHSAASTYNWFHLSNINKSFDNNDLKAFQRSAARRFMERSLMRRIAPYPTQTEKRVMRCFHLARDTIGA
jgi:hypothetical protein